ncbi:MAG: DUF4406 domain-containing protein [Firmicutes bacterium]|nr:DUF4406 domain-containing protein [Bacillota bacterium]
MQKCNGEGYYDPTAYEAVINVAREEKYRPIIYVCSPFRGDEERNAAKAREYCRYAISRRCIPFAPHLLFPQFMNEESDRELAMSFNKIFLGKCDEIWVFGEKITDGMAFEIKTAKRKNIKVRYFLEDIKEVK